MSGNGHGGGHGKGHDDPVQKYMDRSQVAKNLLTHIDTTHIEAYTHAARKVLGVEGDIRQLDLSKLNDAKKQLEFADTMADFYVSSAKQYFMKSKEKGDAWKLDEYDQALIMSAFAGTTKTQLREVIAAEKDQFNSEKFMTYKDKKFMPRIKQDIKNAAGEDLREEHLEDILNYTLTPEVKALLKSDGGYDIKFDAARLLLDNYEGEKLGANDILKINQFLRGNGDFAVAPNIEKKLRKKLKGKGDGHDDEEEHAAAA